MPVRTVDSGACVAPLEDEGSGVGMAPIEVRPLTADQIEAVAAGRWDESAVRSKTRSEGLICDANLDGPWARSKERIAEEVLRLMQWRRALEEGPASARVLRLDFALGACAAALWTLARTPNAPMTGRPALVCNAAINEQVRLALVLADSDSVRWELGFGVVSWLQWLVGGWPAIPYPALE